MTDKAFCSYAKRKPLNGKKERQIASNKRATADYYSQLAKKEGYPARSVYKLEEIEKRFAVINAELPILDVGAAPGSWSLFISRLIKAKGLQPTIVSVDLKEMTVPRKSGITVITGDAFAGDACQSIRDRGPYGTIVSDAAPATTGNRIVDTRRSFSLASSVITLAEEFLTPGGNLVVKIFQGGDEQELMEMVRSRFSQLKTLKPKACRKDSFETYLIGLRKKHNG